MAYDVLILLFMMWMNRSFIPVSQIPRGGKCLRKLRISGSITQYVGIHLECARDIRDLDGTRVDQ